MIIVRALPPLVCVQNGCLEPATVAVFVITTPFEHSTMSYEQFMGRYCQQHSLERVEYHADIEREYGEDHEARPN